jgi:hypothetical protein
LSCDFRFDWVRQGCDTELVVCWARADSRLDGVGGGPRFSAMLWGLKVAARLRRRCLRHLLVVEVVSPGKVNEDRDYRYKRSEYAARGIAEYWIIDPSRARVTVLTLVDGLYEAQELTGNATLTSPQFSDCTLSVAQLLNPRGEA